MNLPECLHDGTLAAIKDRVEITVVLDPITNAEEEGDYGYCPTRAVPILFRHGTVTHTISPDGQITAHPPAPA